MKKIVLVALVVSTFVACKKHVPTITIESPTNRSYPTGQVIPVNINFESEGEIDDIEVVIKNKSKNDEVVFEVKRHIHKKKFEMRGEFTPNVDQVSTMKLEAKVKDHDKKEIAKSEVEFTVNP
jgi:hypothetical protein